jgi:hypothetical protein
MNVYLDSMQWIYFFEGNPQFNPQTRAFILREQAAGSQTEFPQIPVKPPKSRKTRNPQEPRAFSRAELLGKIRLQLLIIKVETQKAAPPPGGFFIGGL